MSGLQDAATATQRSASTSSTVSVSSARRHAREALVDDPARRERPPFHRIWQVVALWLRRRHDRETLRSLSLRDVHDFCPRHSEAEAEMNKPFWRA
jgi:uncharacterized protein YjiS (DUF1127 family)